MQTGFACTRRLAASSHTETLLRVYSTYLKVALATAMIEYNKEIFYALLFSNKKRIRAFVLHRFLSTLHNR
jgi:hypothetical protein